MGWRRPPGRLPVADVQLDRRFESAVDECAVSLPLHGASYACQPLFGRGGEVLGVLTAIGSADARLGAEQLSFMKSLAAQLSLHLQLLRADGRTSADVLALQPVARALQDEVRSLHAQALEHRGKVGGGGGGAVGISGGLGSFGVDGGGDGGEVEVEGLHGGVGRRGDSGGVAAAAAAVGMVVVAAAPAAAVAVAVAAVVVVAARTRHARAAATARHVRHARGGHLPRARHCPSSHHLALLHVW